MFATLIKKENVPEDDRMISDNPNSLDVTDKLCVEEVDPKLLEDIRCPKCAEYYFPPIYLCPKGHNLCNYCKEHLNIFEGASLEFGSKSIPNSKKSIFTPTTTSQVQNKVQNSGSSSSLSAVLGNGFGTSLCGKCNTFFPKDLARRTTAKEKLIKILNFPCGNADKNCSYRHNLVQIAEHERTCTYAPRSCFYDGCDWKDTTESIINHIKEKHTFIIMNEPQSITEGINIYPLLFDSKIFILKTSYFCCKALQFSVLYPGEANKYKFDILLMGNSKDVGIRLTNYCEILMNENVKLKYTLTEDINVPFDFLKHFMTDLQKLCIKINIIKV